ncbi:MAG: AtpZ/AtpI family protein [Calditrichaeota bacterium]|nr:AtpZ/AtpI family protein [Calditrichota bacterium]
MHKKTGNNKTDQKQVNSAFAQAGPYLNIAYFFIGSMAVLGVSGHYLDKFLSWHFTGVLIGLFLGLILGFYHMYKVINQLENKDQKNAD